MSGRQIINMTITRRKAALSRFRPTKHLMLMVAVLHGPMRAVASPADAEALVGTLQPASAPNATTGSMCNTVVASTSTEATVRNSCADMMRFAARWSDGTVRTYRTNPTDDRVIRRVGPESSAPTIVSEGSAGPGSGVPVASSLTRNDLGGNQILWKLHNTNAEHLYVEIDVDTRTRMGVMKRRVVIDPGRNERIFSTVVPPEPILQVRVSELDPD